MDGKQLRNSILQWAIQGKLVPQDPNDEPASVLLERIREEKARLVKEKKIKRDKNESIIFRGDDNSYYEKFLVTGEVKCIDDEIPFDLPNGWSWCRLNELGSYRKGPFGSSLTKSMFVPKSNNTVKVYEQKNAIQKDYRLGEYFITREKFKKMSSFIVSPSDIIVSCAGTIGETYLLPNDAPIGIINQALMRVGLYDLKIAEYWQLFFAYILLVENKMKGAGSAIKNIPPFEYLKAILVPLPPLSEQNRITVKYNSIQSKIKLYTKFKKQYDALKSNIYANLKKSILQEAIQGRLVKQSASDEPASVLLEQIKTEKKRLVKEGKLKKSALEDSVIFKGDDNKYWEKRGKETVCIDDEIPFEIPNTWEWVRFGSLINMRIGKTPPRSDVNYWSDGVVPWVSISDMTDYGTIKTTKEMVSDYAVSMAFGGKIVPAGTLLMSFKLTVGRTSILSIDALHNEAIISITPYIDNNNSLRDYLFFILPLIANYGESKDAIKGKTLNSSSLLTLLVRGPTCFRPLLLT